MAEQPCIVYYTKDPLVYPTTVEDGPFHPSMDLDTPSPFRSHRVELTSALIPWIVDKRRLYERGLFGEPLPPQWTTAPLSILDIYRPLQRDTEQLFGQVVRLLERKKRVQEETAEALGYHVVDAGTAYE